jgi:hypothetical protein
LSINGGGFSYASQSTHTDQVTITGLPTADYNTGLGNYNLWVWGHFTDDVYRHYNSCTRQWDGQVKEDTVMDQSGNYFYNGPGGTLLSDFSWRYFTTLTIGQQSQITVNIAFNQFSSTTQGLSADASLSFNPSSTGGSYSGSLTLAGFSAFYSQTSGSNVMYAIKIIGPCQNYIAYNTGWILGWGAAPRPC